ncbi:hypothetical protein [Chroococcidiopsis sp. SAG 2025]|nr:hypothetical protein [Chroococcidiopsis sp. SAG 2025]
MSEANTGNFHLGLALFFGKLFHDWLTRARSPFKRICDRRRTKLAYS